MNIILNGSKQEASTLVVDIVSDLICPWCFIAKRRVEKAAALLHQEIEIRWLPFLLNPSMPKDGWNVRCTGQENLGVGQSHRGLMPRWQMLAWRLELRLDTTG